jgi:N-carbamoylputrescine amidase
MKVTICELSNRDRGFVRDWDILVRHVRKHKSDLVLLPEMTFYPWFAWRRTFRADIWRSAVEAHQRWQPRLKELEPAVVCGSLPADAGGRWLNRAFIWDHHAGFRTVHDKRHLPNETGFWEKNWYEPGDGDFASQRVSDFRLGFMICTELWFFQHARGYGRAGSHFILCPRATPHDTLDKWLAGGRAAAVVSGAFCLSSNRISTPKERADLGGQGWIIDPDGRILGVTSPSQPFLSLDVNLARAARAKHTYPRYVLD